MAAVALAESRGRMAESAAAGPRGSSNLCGTSAGRKKARDAYGTETRYQAAIAGDAAFSEFEDRARRFH